MESAATSKQAFDSLPNQSKLYSSNIALFSPGGKLQCAGQEAACKMGVVARFKMKWIKSCLETYIC